MNICYNRDQEKIGTNGKNWKFGSVVARLRRISAARNRIVSLGLLGKLEEM